MRPDAVLRAGLIVGGLGLVALALAEVPDDPLPSRAPELARPAGALLADGFDDGHLAGWRADRSGVWSVRSGMLEARLPDARQQHSFLYTGDSTWTDYALDADICGMRGVDKGLAVRVRGGRGLGVDLRGTGYEDVKLQLNQIPVGQATVPNANAAWHHVRAEIQGKRCRVFVDGTLALERHVPIALPRSGGIALAAYTGGIGACTVFYDNVVVTRLPAAANNQRATR